MRRLIHILFVLLCLSSCKDCYYVENDLHGIWQVMSIEKFPEGKVTEARGQLYYMFQRTMVQLGYKPLNSSKSMKHYISHIDFIGQESLGMGGFRARTTGEGDYVNKESKIPLDSLRRFGLYNDYTTFYMEQSKQNLILISDSARIVLRRY